MSSSVSYGKQIGGGLWHALPFWSSLIVIPVAWVAAIHGGWTIALLPVCTWYLHIALDSVLGLDTGNTDPETPESHLFWYRLVTLLWVPAQIMTVFGILGFVSSSAHLSLFEQWALFAALGLVYGTIGINFAHELMHQKPRLERWLADLLLATVLYSHFRSEHLLVHHRYVGTPRDTVTARFGESFYKFITRVPVEGLVSAFRAEQAMLARRGLPWWHRSNPFWRYWALELAFAMLAIWIGGWWGLFLWATQAFWAVFQLELVNYIEHYALTRRHLGDGKYEHVLPRHSWNSAHKASNWLLLNLQRHSDHHYKPDRRFPLLQTYSEDDAPQLPHGYPVMSLAALIPPLWRRIMHPRVWEWRQTFYPDITDWGPYNKAQTPLPK